MMMRVFRTLSIAVVGALAGACATAPRPAPSPPPAARPATPQPAKPRPAMATAGRLPAVEHEYLRERWLMVPVAGVRAGDVPDTFRARRAGNRQHNATDIMAPRGTPVVSADAGRVVKLARNDAGGITIYATDSHERIMYYYAHLDRYHDGLVEGMKLAKGQVIGYVGTTGNAPANTPHLHFQAMRTRDVRRWWEGDPVDIRPYLVEDGQRR